MNRRLALLMCKEVQKQADFALMAVEGIDSSFEKADEIKNINHNLWFNMQMFLVSAANVSKLIWGTNYTDSMTLVKDLLEIKNDSALKSRRLRNHFEHYDERLINWDESSKHKNIVLDNIGPSNMIKGIDKKDIFRHYDNTKGVVTFRGETFNLVPIVKELKRIIKIELPDW